MFKSETRFGIEDVKIKRGKKLGQKSIVSRTWGSEKFFALKNDTVIPYINIRKSVMLSVMVSVKIFARVLCKEERTEKYSLCITFTDFFIFV